MTRVVRLVGAGAEGGISVAGECGSRIDHAQRSTSTDGWARILSRVHHLRMTWSYPAPGRATP
jgi:hypothetical protein